MKKALSAIGNYFKNLGIAFVKGDIWVKLSAIVMGAGYFARKQIINGIIMLLVEAVFVVMCIGYAAPNLAKFGTLGTVQFEQVFDPLTMTSTVNDYDNSFMILLNSIIALFMILVFVIFWIANMKAVYRLQLKKENGQHINTFREDVRSMFNEKFHITLLTLPTIGIILMNILPILVLVAVAFTNYDQQHMPPNSLFTWVGWSNFKNLFANSITVTFGYSFKKVLVWTLEWAVLATFTTYIGGILLAKFINDKKTKM
ncbi:MAG: sugar ABC transporter permease, partial [Lachnospiraceae bacterium]|nr:sugar ABC transporter permease [Lachnospiraceae bacterium]